MYDSDKKKVEAIAMFGPSYRANPTTPVFSVGDEVQLRLQKKDGPGVWTYLLEDNLWYPEEFLEKAV